MLDQVIPFRYLSPEQREALRGDLTEETFEPGEVLIEQGDREDTRVFLIAEGSVRLLDRRFADRGPPRTVTAGHYIGERAALFDEPRAVEVQAAEAVRALTMSGDRFLRLVHESTPFAQALGGILRSKQAIFAPFDRFLLELLRAVGRGSIDLERLLPFYQQLEPALHPGATNPDELDIGALTYAVRRLPDNLTRTLAFYLTETLPALYVDPDSRFRAVPTAARRRAVYEMIPGKNMVLVRDGASDLVDLISCLCLYTIEARKIRRRVRDRGGLDFVGEVGLDSLATIWPSDTADRVKEIAMHHEDFRIEVHKEPNDYNSAHAETWCKQIAEATRTLYGCDPADLPSDLAVHVISSNTHSVPNCLSPWIGRNAQDILEWGRSSGHPFADDLWHDEYDLACALARDYVGASPERREERARAERQAGILNLGWTAFTGIAVQLIDTARVQWSDTDPGIPNAAPSRPSLVVNIDYAFGEQAEHIVGNLASLFGRNLASVNVLGKAGGLVGERGDVLVATGFVEQYRNHFHAIPGDGRMDLSRLRARLPDRRVHVGTMLTVTGTLLQNRTMLHFNRHIWRCMGLEMEGAFYLRHLVQSMNRGAISQDVALRFLYYTSDLPLRHDANLSARLRAAEGVPPLYAVTREVLTEILEL
ncbi:MAG: cyclic nucleotide-binding domain-containing protein [Gemmatimonadetes bacterium]|nr:cyclic nucleotide-binding domain-containing protein [Gemmatimonadota bacterium]MDA1101980.1 cyclic nucleotide-binding domain-containing protein [Gemmatimonadota bacterium]